VSAASLISAPSANQFVRAFDRMLAEDEVLKVYRLK
jgi:hypothetical protein